MPKYYVYILRHPITNIPFYVGKGCRNRAYQHTTAVRNGKQTDNAFKDAVIRKILELNLEPIVEIHQDLMSETEAYECEVRLIGELGRRSNDSGPLTNLTEGGDAPPPATGRPKTEKQLHAAIDNIRGKFAGHSHTNEWVEEHVKRHTGQRRAESTKQKIEEKVHSKRRDKTYAEIYGNERAEQLREQKRSSMIGKNLGKRRSDETIAKIKASKQNISDETRKKMSEAAKARAAKRRLNKN